MSPQLYWQYGGFVVAERRSLPVIQVTLMMSLMYNPANTACIEGVLSRKAHFKDRPVIVPRATV